MVSLHCPTCRKTFTFDSLADAECRPFCSRRCQSIDLGKWLAEDYRISEPLEPGRPIDPAPDDETLDADPAK